MHIFIDVTKLIDFVNADCEQDVPIFLNKLIQKYPDAQFHFVGQSSYFRHFDTKAMFKKLGISSAMKYQFAPIFDANDLRLSTGAYIDAIVQKQPNAKYVILLVDEKHLFVYQLPHNIELFYVSYHIDKTLEKIEKTLSK